MGKVMEQDIQAKEKVEGSEEHAFSAVPEKDKKSLLSLTLVLAGYPIALSNFVIGGAVGVGMKFWEAMGTLLVGNLFLIALVIFVGMSAYETGLSTSVLSRRAFGKKGSSIFSILLIISSVTWISLNGDIFSRLIHSTFSWWKFSIPITSILCIGLWTLSAIQGYDGLEIISYLGVPAAIIMSVIGLGAAITRSGGLVELMNYTPKEVLSFSAATSSIIGGWIFGATITPDVCRFGKSKKDVVIAIIVAFSLGCFGLQTAGALVAIATGHGDFVVAMGILGLTMVAFIAAVFCLWTTQNNNIYGAALAAQNMFDGTKLKNLEYKKIALLIGLLAGSFAFLGIYEKILPIIQFLSILIPPIPGIMIAEEYIVKRNNDDKVYNPVALISWLGGGLISLMALKLNFFVPPIIGVLSSMVLYVVLSKVKSVN